MPVAPFAILVTLIYKIEAFSSPVATAPDGAYTGYAMESSSGREFWAFSGIRYAQPPIGELRFKEPKPVEPFVGVYEAIEEGPPCLQIDPLTSIADVTGSEDCLYLNIYTHSVNSSVPVMLWIHGGGWMWGSGTKTFYGPDYLMNEDIVLISINYRLGPIGFASLENKIMTGNYGLKDQEEAIRWTKRNVAAFGGDPEAITIFGQSAGAEAVTLLLKGPVANLVQAGIAMSGSSLTPNGPTATSYVKSSTLIMARLVGCNDKAPDPIIHRCLQKADAKRMIWALVFAPWVLLDRLPPFKPIVEPGGSIPVDPRKANTSSKIRLMAGHTTAELGFFSSLVSRTGGLLTPFLSAGFNILAPSLLMYRRLASNPDKISDKIRSFYFKKGANTYELLEQAMTDSWFAYPAREEIENYQGPVYSYVFDYKGTPSLYDLLNITSGRTGPGHADDLVYLFRIKIAGRILDLSQRGTASDEQLSKTMVRMWTRFAKGLDPTPENSLGTDWGKSSKNGGYLLISNDGFRIIDKANDTSLYKKRLDFWSTLPLKTRKTYRTQ